jgi:histidinol dehydrogenase
MNLRIINAPDGAAEPAVIELRDKLRAGGLTSASAGPLDVPGIVREILDDIADRGDEALVDWEKQLDGAVLSPQTLRVEPDRIARARELADADFMALIGRAAENIRAYQQHIRLQAPPELVRGGRRLGVRYTAVDRAAVYVPGGRALYPSTVLMTVIPAQVAGVREVVMASPPTRDGDIDPMVLALAAELGVGEVYRLGGAVAIGALACGTPSVKPVAKIVGPGNAFVAEAKRQVLGKVGIDSIAGPSEVLIVADGTARPDWLAADLLAQAEHDPGSAILVTPDAELAGRVVDEVTRQLDQLERSQAAAAGLEAYGAIIVTPDLASACEVADAFATEHLQIITSDDEFALSRIRDAGAIFIGSRTPVPLGDYYAGPSHVLPTGGTARFFGPLSCNDFLKASSTLRYDAQSLAADAPDVIDFAGREGLTAHARAVGRRIGR